MTKGVISIALLEWRIALRNYWLLSAVVMMTVFALLLALLGGASVGSLGVDRLVVTASSLSTLSVYLVPLIALVLSYDAFAGETDRGTLPLLLTYPVPRPAIVIGKFTAHCSVLAVSVIVGFGLVTAVLTVSGGVSAAGLNLMARMVASAILLGGVFVAVGYVVSLSVRQTTTAAGLGILVWVIAVVMLDIALLGLLVADDGQFFTPSVFPWLMLASPTDAFRMFNLAAFDPLIVETGAAAAAQGFEFSPVASLGAMAIWTCLMLGLATAKLWRCEP